MTQIRVTRKKCREAEFFLNHMTKAAQSLPPDREDFSFYLSAFLSAARSVTLFLQAEQKTSYDAWFPGWKAALNADDQKLLSFMNEQRRLGVHQRIAQRHGRGDRVNPIEKSRRV